MSRFVFIWEMGGGYGHLQRFLPVALQLKNAGHEVVLVLRDLLCAESVLGPHGLTYLQAPVPEHSANAFPVPRSYVEIMLNRGFGSAQALLTLTKAWRAQYALLNPDVFIFYNETLALFAARGLSIPKAFVSTGFCTPPHTVPMPGLQPWLDVAPHTLANSEQKLLEVMNRVLALLQLDPLANAAQLFDVDTTLLCTFAELDHYGTREGASYYGPCLNISDGAAPVWPSGAGVKIFAYLNADYPHLAALCSQARELDMRFLFHVRGASPRLIRQLESHNVLIAPEPLDLRQVAAQCAAVLTHSSHGTVCRFLLAGCPQLLLPLHAEQLLLAKKLARCGVGMMVSPDHRQPDFKKLFSKLISTAEIREGAANFARNYALFDAQKNPEIIAQKLMSLG